MAARSHCPHVTTVGDNSWEDVLLKKRHQVTCQTCGAKGPNLWLCLHSRCLYVGCGESVVDHSGAHADAKKHFLTLNMTTDRIWCYSCEVEVFKDANHPPLIMCEKSLISATLESNPIPRQPTAGPVHNAEDSDSDEEDEGQKARGLVGLQNMGNTCYMNAALQALSNCPPLTRFFLDCPGFVRTDKKPMLCRSYMKLVQEIWSKKRPSYVIPSGVAHGIKMVHPMFRGYTQQDTQEFLRCFMDQIHEELKQPVLSDLMQDQAENADSESTSDDFSDSSVLPTQPLVDTHTHSDTDYETCDSGMSSEPSSVEQVSGDEATEGNDTAYHSRKSSMQSNISGPSNRFSLKSSNRINPCDTNSGSVADVDSEHQSEKNTDASGCVQGESSQEKTLPDPEASEYLDAVTEVELPEGQKVKPEGQRSRCASESERLATRTHVTTLVKQTSPGKKKKNIEYTSVISDIFDGKILSSVQCLTCERVSSTKETFQDLSLPIPSKDHLHMLHANQGTTLKGSCGEVNLNQGWFAWMFGWMKSSWFWGPTISLRDCLAAFFSADELKGDNMYSCEKCKKLRNGVKYSKVMKLPEILCIHLKRFRHEFMFSSKISSYVAFPMEGLDMGPYLHKDCQDEVTVYDLIGVICHHGTAGGGHYTAYCHNHLNEQWYEFDDQYVTEVDMQQVENCEAYVLFYRKRNVQMYSKRQRARDMLDTEEGSLMKFYISKRWINQFNTFSEPGPITNHDFLCKHGGVPPNKCTHVEELYTELPQSVWEYLHEEYKGGPAVNHLYQCDICLTELERLKKRQKNEMETFIKLNQDFQSEENPAIIFAISMAWFKEWENFVKARVDDPPGPIDNSRISTTKNGQTVVRLSSDYGQLSEEMWQFLYDIYGGGPELVLRQNIRPPSPRSIQDNATEQASKVTDSNKL